MILTEKSNQQVGVAMTKEGKAKKAKFQAHIATWVTLGPDLADEWYISGKGFSFLT